MKRYSRDADAVNGKVFGSLTVLSIVRKRMEDGYTHQIARCRCICGKLHDVPPKNLKKGATTSCGCMRGQNITKAKTRHGCSGGKQGEYNSWCSLIGRCENPTNRKYLRYGGRGISVCDRWRNSFEAFFEDMGPRPSSRHTIDRIDNNGNYEPGNVRWATAVQQSRNRSITVTVSHDGETRPLSEWSEITGFSYKLLHERLFRRGWTTEMAFTPPVRRKR